MSESDQTGIEIPTPWGALKAHGSDAVMMMLVGAMISVAVILYFLLDETKQSRVAITGALTAQTITTRELVTANRLQACINAFPEKSRLEQLNQADSFCKKVAQYQ